MNQARPTNNFDALRLGAALAVLASHSVPLSYGNNEWEPVWRASQHQATLGHLSVAVFFVISGYLITASYARRPDPVRFVGARVLRLLPGLAVMLALVTVVAGLLLTTLPLADYFASPATLRFFVGNLSVFAFTANLPGVFGSNPFPSAVNGSLWTLAYEVECYAAVLLLGVAGCLTRWVALAALGALLLASGMWWGGDLVEFGSYFAGGAVMLFTCVLSPLAQVAPTSQLAFWRRALSIFSSGRH